MLERVEVVSSVRQQLCRLKVGETYSRAVRMSLDDSTNGDVVATKAALRNTLQSSRIRAEKDTGHELQLDSGEFLATDGYLIVVVTVTRIA